VRTDAVAISTVMSPYGQTRAVIRTPVGFSAQRHTIAANLAGMPLSFSRACPVQVVDTSQTGVPTEPVLLLLAASSTGWGETDLDAALGTGPGSLSYDPARDIPHPVVMGAAIAAPGAGPLGTLGPPEPRKVVIGCTAAFTDAGLDADDDDSMTPSPEADSGRIEPALQLLRNSVNWLVRDAALPEITPRILKREIAAVPQWRWLRLMAAFLGLLPLAVVVLGITVWRLRRR
jgi:hypothetical protein